MYYSRYDRHIAYYLRISHRGPKSSHLAYQTHGNISRSSRYWISLSGRTELFHTIGNVSWLGFYTERREYGIQTFCAIYWLQSASNLFTPWLNNTAALFLRFTIHSPRWLDQDPWGLETPPSLPSIFTPVNASGDVLFQRTTQRNGAILNTVAQSTSSYDLCWEALKFELTCAGNAGRRNRWILGSPKCFEFSMGGRCREVAGPVQKSIWRHLLRLSNIPYML